MEEIDSPAGEGVDSSVAIMRYLLSLRHMVGNMVNNHAQFTDFYDRYDIN